MMDISDKAIGQKVGVHPSERSALASCHYVLIKDARARGMAKETPQDAPQEAEFYDRALADRAAARALHSVSSAFVRQFIAEYGSPDMQATFSEVEDVRCISALSLRFPGCASTALQTATRARSGALHSWLTRMLLADITPEDEEQGPPWRELLPPVEALREAIQDPSLFHRSLLPLYRFMSIEASSGFQEERAAAVSDPASRMRVHRVQVTAEGRGPAETSAAEMTDMPESFSIGAQPYEAPAHGIGTKDCVSTVKQTGSVSEAPSTHIRARSDKEGEYMKYKIYTTRFDKVVNAETLLGDAPRRLPEAPKEGLFKEGVKPLDAKGKRAAARFAGALAGIRTEEEEMRRVNTGSSLDPGMLASWVTGSRSLEGRFRRRSAPEQGQDCAAVLLVDNSGSMRGVPAFLAAHAAYRVCLALERAGWRTEILGHTTSTWNGGRSARLWRANGSPSFPGRLADLLCVVYKSAENSVRRAPLAAMLKPDLAKENIDGEALHWAYERLSKLPAERKTLVVISDGSPADDATAAACGREYLCDHLRHVAKRVRKELDGDLLAIGIGCDVDDFYPGAAKALTPEDLAETLFDRLYHAVAT